MLFLVSVLKRIRANKASGEAAMDMMKENSTTTMAALSEAHATIK